MNDTEKQLLKIGLALLKNNDNCILTNVEIEDNENIISLIEEGEKLLQDEGIDDIEIDTKDISKIMNEIYKGVKYDKQK